MTNRFWYKGRALGCGYRLDFLIEEELVLELKAVHELSPIHRAQLQTYLKLSDRPLGVLVNFNVPLFKDGISRVVSGELFRNETLSESDFARFAPSSLCGSNGLNCGFDHKATKR